MSLIKITTKGFNKVATILLGQKYTIENYGHKETDGFFIRTTKKGLNFLVIKNHKCLFKRPLYQVNSANRKIKKGQETFDICFPKWVMGIRECQSNIEIPRKPRKALNALYRMEME